MMKERKEIIHFVFMAIWAGVVIGIGGCASLLMNNLLGGAWGRLLGGCVFTLGIYLIVAFQMRLFTGMVGNIPYMDKRDVWQIPVCFLGNALGLLLVTLVARYTAIGEQIKTQASALISGKLDADNSYIKCLLSAIMCGLLITFSVRSPLYADKKGLSVTVGVIFPIIIFAFCGFDHSVANMMYFYLYGKCSWFIVGYILITILGNLIGGILFPLTTSIYEKKANKTEE